jgi:serine phosphatase RsbU (regulator of sigma subunit)
VLIVVFREVNKIEYTNVLYASGQDGFNFDRMLDKIAGQKTLLITEGYQFGKSMFNFVVVNGQPRFEINEEKLEQVGIRLPSTVLAAAVKTREDWEKLYSLTSEELERQLEVVEQQRFLLEEMKVEIERQRALLDSLDREVIMKEAELAARQKELNLKSAEVRIKTAEINRQQTMIAEQQSEVMAQRDTLDIQRASIDSQVLKINNQLDQIGMQEEKIRIQVEEIEKQKIVLYAVLFVTVLLTFLAYYIYRGFKIKKEANIKLEEKNRTILAQNAEIEKQRDLAETQRDQIAYQKKHITDSIMYAKRIQTALLPSLELFTDQLEHFVLYRPLDIVSGDFYWVSHKEDKHIIIAADCTGHGVPGAFMSMLGVTMLNQLVNGKGIIRPDEILNNLRTEIVRSLKQSIDENRVKDGMDMAVIVIDHKKEMLLYSGANSPLCIVRDGKLVSYKGDKMPVAIHFNMDKFTLHEIKLRKGDCLYMFSDGFGDQFGGKRQKKFMVKNLKNSLIELSSLPMIEQGEKLNNIFDRWKGNTPQVDDVTIIGVRY